MIVTARPDPAADLIGYLAWLGDELQSVKQLLGERRVRSSEARRVLGLPDTFFHGRPWRIPGFGLQGSYHTLATFKAWLDIPEAERRAEWDAMPLEERRKARGIA